MSLTKHSSPYEVLKIRDFRYYVLGRMGITFGINILGTAVGWQIYEHTKDALSLGLIGLVEFVPFIIVTLIGGYIADIFDRRKIILTCVSLYSLCALGLYLLSDSFAYIIDSVGVTPIFVLIGATGLVRGFLGPAQSAFAAQLVPSELYANSATWTTMSWHISAVGGPAVAGLLCGWHHSAWSSYAVVVALATIGLVLITTVKSRHAAKNTLDTEGGQKQREGFFDSVRVGLSFVKNNQFLLGALALDMFAVLFGGAVAMLPAFAKDILAVGPEGFGMLRTAPAVGALVMSVYLAYNPPVKNAGVKLLVSVAGFGICTILFALSDNFIFSLFMLAGTGFFDNVSMVIRGTIVSLFTPDEMRGRVSAVNSLFIGSSNELGAFESGLAARLMGLVPSVVFGGVMTMIVVATAWVKAPKLRGLDLR
ncbi:MAG: MFS transporter [Saprospiraceae bacterium]|nr:MFS transporter [Saprospiraceae bacterium]